MTQEEITRMLENVGQKDVEQLFKYLRMQKAENEALAKGKTQKEIVQEYLNALSKLDPELATVYPENKTGKTIDDCFEYIEDNARKMRTDGKNTVTVTSYTVFEWAVTYFLDETINKFEIKKSTATTTKYDPIPGKIKTLQANKEKWQQENDKKVQAWETENNAKIDEFEKAHANDLFPAINPFANNTNPYLNAVFPQQEELDKLLAEQRAKKEKNAETEQQEDNNNPEENNCETDLEQSINDEE